MPDQKLPGRGGSFYPPFLQNFQTFQKEMAQMFDHFGGGARADGTDDRFAGGRKAMPAIDVAETETGLEITADIPGVREDELDVTVQGETLVIKGEGSARTEDKKKEYHLVERRYGCFRRHVPLGFLPEKGVVEADFAHGMLTLRIRRPANVAGGIRKVRIDKA